MKYICQNPKCRDFGDPEASNTTDANGFHRCMGCKNRMLETADRHIDVAMVAAEVKRALEFSFPPEKADIYFKEVYERLGGRCQYCKRVFLSSRHDVTCTDCVRKIKKKEAREVRAKVREQNSFKLMDAGEEPQDE